MNEKTREAFSKMSQAEYKLSDANSTLKAATKEYHEALTFECIHNILKVQSEEGKLTERDLFIFLRELVNKVSC